MGETLGDGLQKLVGEVLSSVEFVADYVQLRFNGPVLTAFTAPSVSRAKDRYVWAQAGYRDALCAEIGCTIERTTVDDQQVSIAFQTGTVFSISLRDEDYGGPEALKFDLDDKHWWVA